MITSRQSFGCLFVIACLTATVSAPAQTLVWDRVAPPPAPVEAGFGSRLWVISDLDGDQVRDLLVASPSASYIGVLSGASGSTIGEVVGSSALGYFDCLGAIGDTTGDGFVDIIAIYLPPGPPSSVYTLILSGADGSLVASVLGHLGLPYPIGDVNSDGYGDFAMHQGSLHGALAIYHGPGFNYAYTVSAFWAYSTFGKSVAPCGDVNGDGFADFIVGAPGEVANWQYPEVVPGFAYVFSGATGALIHSWTGPFVGSHFGRAVVSPGDLNGDGVPDVVVSAPGAGAMTLTAFSGTNGSQIGFYADPSAVYDWFGTVLSSMGDVDGDAISDYAALGTQVEVFSGATTTPIYHLTTNLPVGLTGWLPRTFVGLDDFNGDDFPEIVIGAPPMAVYVQPGHVQCYTLRPIGLSVVGNGCPQSTGSVARIGATGVPQVNSTFPITLSKVALGLPAGLMVGLSNTQYASSALPLPIDPVLVPGCWLYTSIDWFLPTMTTSVGPGVGRAILPLSIPSGATGLSFFAQWGVLNPPGASILGSVTRSIAVTVQ